MWRVTLYVVSADGVGGEERSACGGAILLTGHKDEEVRPLPAVLLTACWPVLRRGTPYNTIGATKCVGEARDSGFLVLPQELFDEVLRIVAARYSTVVEVLRQFIRLGLLVAQTERFTNAACIDRQGGESLRRHLSSILTQENHP